MYGNERHQRAGEADKARARCDDCGNTEGSDRDKLAADPRWAHSRPARERGEAKAQTEDDAQEGPEHVGVAERREWPRSRVLGPRNRVGTLELHDRVNHRYARGDAEGRPADPPVETAAEGHRDRE